jgi:hypothetical protein
MNQLTFFTHPNDVVYPSSGNNNTWTDTLRLKRKMGEPLLEQLIANDEEHNPYLTLWHVRAWPDIWVSEHLEQHGFWWNDREWTRSEEDKAISWLYRWRPAEPLNERAIFLITGHHPPYQHNNERIIQ